MCDTRSTSSSLPLALLRWYAHRSARPSRESPVTARIAPMAILPATCSSAR